MAMAPLLAGGAATALTSLWKYSTRNRSMCGRQETSTVEGLTVEPGVTPTARSSQATRNQKTSYLTDSGYESAAVNYRDIAKNFPFILTEVGNHPQVEPGHDRARDQIRPNALSDMELLARGFNPVHAMRGQVVLLLLAAMATKDYHVLERMSDLCDIMEDLLAGNY